MLSVIESVTCWFGWASEGRDHDQIKPTSWTMKLAAAVGCAAAMATTHMTAAGPCDTDCAVPSFGAIGTDCYSGIVTLLDDYFDDCKSCRDLNALPPPKEEEFMNDLVVQLALAPGACDCGEIIAAANDSLVANGFSPLSPSDIDYIQGERGCAPDVDDWMEGDAEPKIFGNFFPNGHPPCEYEDSVNDGSGAPDSIRYGEPPPPAPGPKPPPLIVPTHMGMAVDRATGQKLEREIDLSVALTGDNFTLERMYRGASGDSGPGLVGMHWRMNWFSYIVEAAGAEPMKLYGRNTVLEFEETDPGVSEIWVADGPATQVIEEKTLNYDDGSGAADYAVWRLVEPGGWELDYFRAHDHEGDPPPSSEFTGALAQKRDVHGNTQTYYYTTLSKTGGGDTIRLERIEFERDTGSGMETIAEVRFYWDKHSANAGRLMGVEVYRGNTVTQRVDYKYKDAGDSVHDAVGTEGDLIQVDRYVLVDGGSPTEPEYRRLVTMYRYHGGLAAETDDDPMNGGDGDGYIETGPAHALKMVILPEQIEFFVQKRIGELASPHYGESFESALKHLRESADSVLLGSNLPAKMITKHDGNGRVLEQHLLAACGCSGSALGRMREYAYYDHVSGPYAKTTRIRDWADPLDVTPDFHSDAYFDLVEIDGAYRVANHAGVERNSGMAVTREWVQSHVYNGEGELELIITPAANTTRDYLTADEMDGPGFDNDESEVTSGLVFGYVYDDNHRLTEARLSDGVDTADYDIGTDFTLIAKTTYDSTRPYLVTKIEQVRTEGTDLPTDRSEIETTEFEYGFYTGGGDDLAWIKTRVEKEREEENGTVTGTGEEFFDSYRLYDPNGRLVWTRSPDNVLSFRGYDDDTGQVVTVIQNASTSQTPALSNWTSGLESNLTVTGWGRYGTNGVYDLKTTYTRDKLGRVTHVSSPGGVDSWIVREMAENPLRPGLAYYREVMVPDIITDGSSPVLAGPVEVSWMNAGDGVIRSSGYEMDDVDDGDVQGTYVLGTELSRSAIVHYASGLVQEARAWHDVAGNGVYTTGFEYDDLGRTITRTAANGTQTHYVYDIMDRVIETRIGVSGETALTVMEYFYDSDLNSPAQGVGNGNITVARQHVDSGTTRTIRNAFDFRDRLVMTENPDEPHSAMAYDNLDRVVEQVVFKGPPPTPRTFGNVTHANRGRHVLTHYGQRGMVYMSQIAIDPAEDTTPLYLETHRWFDEAGRVVGQWGPNAPGSKTTYDALGRVVKSYVTDRGGDVAPGGSGNYADVYNTGTHSAVLTDDTVLEQTEYAYVDSSGYGERGEGQVSLVTHRMLTHDAAAGDGALGTGAVTTFRGFFYDTANRLIRTADFGTNQSAFAEQGGTSAPTVTQTSPPSPDAGDATRLVAAVTYNTRGLTEFEEDPEEILTRTLYDDLGRVIAVIENYDDAVVAWDSGAGRWKVTGGITDAAPSTDRVTSFVYNGVGEIVRRVAHIPVGTSETVQETIYTYAARTSAGDEINSNDLLTMIQYPDESAGTAGTTAAYKVLYSYNRSGELVGETDQNQTVKAYTRDGLGRVTSVEAVIGMGSDVDDTIDTIEYAYDEFGRLSKVTSRYKSGNAVANEIAYAYDSLWQLEGIKQNPVGATSAFTYTSDVLDLPDGTIGYLYHTDHAGATAPSNQSRLSEIEYPLLPSTATVRTVLTHAYGSTPGDVNDTISRVSGLTWNTGDTAGTHTVHKWEQGFLGLSTPATGVADQALGGAGLKLDRFIDPSTGDATSGLYQGFDRYGRVTHQHWADGGWADFDSSTPTRPAIYDLGYGYSNHSDIGTRTDERSYASLMDRDEEYAYDGLHRLVGAERGVSQPRSQGWTLDMLGNWGQWRIETDGSAGYDITQDRSHNKANEIVDVDSGSGSWGGWEYDDNGNLTLEYLSETSRRRFAYDPWDRLVRVGYEVYEDEGEGGWSGEQDRARFTYYGLHQRATTRLDLDQDEEFEPDQAVHYYYDASWRLLERRIDADYTDDWDDDGSFTSDPGDIETHQYIWGTGYIDELLYYQRDLNKNHNFNDDSAGKHYVLRDRNYSVIGVATGTSLERVRYTPYGESQVQIPADVTGEGTIDVDDFNAILSAIGGTIDGSVAGYTVEADVNRDGIVDIDDLNIYLSAPTGSVPANTIGYGTGNIIGYAGYIYEEELGMYLVRHRWYTPRNGRWNTRDPAGYLDGGSLYLSVGSNPINSTDPFGLLTIDFDSKNGFTPLERVAVMRAITRISTCLQRMLAELAAYRVGLSDCACKKLDRQFDELRLRLREMHSILNSKATGWYIEFHKYEFKNVEADTINLGGSKRRTRIRLDITDWATLWDDDELARVLFHEFFHVVEYARGEPDYDGTYLWYRDPSLMQFYCITKGKIYNSRYILVDINAAKKNCGDPI